jgi:tRNA threonylcarbamoyladenosine biosynthesis protein TsaE
MLELFSNSADSTIKIGKLIGSSLTKGTVIAYKGTLAAGKTTLTKGIAEALEIDEVITSPTFTLVSEYEGKLPLYHFDVYRLDTVEDFLNIGSEEMMYGEGVCAIEWSEKIESALPKDAIIIDIEILTPETRKITIKNWPYDKNIFSEFIK